MFVIFWKVIFTFVLLFSPISNKEKINNRLTDYKKKIDSTSSCILYFSYLTYEHYAFIFLIH